jgi:hypothetical protein
MRRRLVWLLAALLAVIAAPTEVRSASVPERPPRLHVAGSDRVVHRDDGSSRTTIPWLVRPGSERRAPAPVASSGSSAASPLAPVVVPPTFDGIPNIDPPLATPADPTGALGVTYHLAAVNTHMAFYDRTGAELDPPRLLEELDDALPAAARSFDPKVVYDHYRQRFLLVFLSATNTQSFLSVVVIPEGSEDTTNGWCTLHMSGDQVAGNGKQFADYPSVGFTESRVTITTNQYDFSNAPSIGGFRYVQMISTGKDALYDCDRPVVPIKVFSRTQTRDPDGSRAFTIVPAVSIAGAPTAQFMTSIDFNGSSGKLILWRLTVAGGSEFRLVRTQVAGGPMSLPPWGRQCGNTGGLQSKWDTGDVRLTSTFWDAALGRLYTATSIAGNLGGGAVESVVRWWEVDPAATLANSTVPRRGIVGRAGRDAAWPSLATDSEGKLWVNYARAGVSECLTAMASVVQPGATAHAAVSIRTGSGRYEASAGPERWGDYTAVSRDPLNGTQMAAYGAHPVDDGGASHTQRWQQVIATLTDV